MIPPNEIGRTGRKTTAAKKDPIAGSNLDGGKYSNVVALRPSRNYAECAGCRIRFVPREPTHELCDCCFHWTRAGWHRDRSIQHRLAAEGLA